MPAWTNEPGKRPVPWDPRSGAPAPWDPMGPAVTPPAQHPVTVPPPDPVRLEVDPAEPQRRLTVAIRFVLAVPLLMWWWAFGIASGFATLCGWFAALVTARLPDRVARFTEEYLRLTARTLGYLMFLTDRYPGFERRARPDYPVRLVVPAPGRLNRAAVFFRYPLGLPVGLLSGFLLAGWYVLSGPAWVATLILGRPPQVYADAASTVLRSAMRVHAYSSMVTARYPGGFLGDRPDRPGYPASFGTGRFVLGVPVKVVLVVYLLVGALGWGAAVYADVQIVKSLQAAQQAEIARLQARQRADAAAQAAAAAQENLWVAIPAGVRPGCRPWTDPQPYKGELAATVCDLPASGGLTGSVTYYLFSDQPTMDSVYQGVLGGIGIGPGDGSHRCGQGDGQPGGSPWLNPNATSPGAPPAGQFACGAYNDNTGARFNIIQWTSYKGMLMGQITASSLTLETLTDYWSRTDLAPY